MARMEHFAIFAADPKSLKDFYIEAFGLRMALDNGAASPPGYFLVDDAGMALEIICRPEGSGRPTRDMSATSPSSSTTWPRNAAGSKGWA
jgi:catechol 2,3-dioxygenase-like lactoylglutathione lyase family enzyme